MDKSKLIKYINISLIAALYASLSIILGPFSYGEIQVRLAETLIVLVFFKSEAVFGLTIGCFLANVIGLMLGINTLGMMDVVFGTLATFISSLLAYHFRAYRYKKIPLLSLMMPVLVNAIIIGIELNLVLLNSLAFKTFIIFASYVMLGQFIACVVFGIPLYRFLVKTKLFERL